MNSPPLHSTKIPGFTIVPKHRLGDAFRDSRSGFYVLLGHTGHGDTPRERVVFVDYVDDLLDACEQRIADLWEKHRVAITHVAVKLGDGLRHEHRNLRQAYERALAIQELRQKLNPRFRRL